MTQLINNILMLLFLPFIAISCQQASSSGKAEPFSQDVVLEKGKKTTITPSDDKSISFALTLTEVQDSRCPEGTNCMWAGNAIATITVASNDIAAHKLCLGECTDAEGVKADKSTDTLAFQVKEKHYYLILKAIDPYPSADLTGNVPKKEPVKASVTIKSK